MAVLLVVAFAASECAWRLTRPQAYEPVISSEGRRVTPLAFAVMPLSLEGIGAAASQYSLEQLKWQGSLGAEMVDQGIANCYSFIPSRSRIFTGAEVTQPIEDRTITIQGASIVLTGETPSLLVGQSSAYVAFQSTVDLALEKIGFPVDYRAMIGAPVYGRNLAEMAHVSGSGAGSTLKELYGS
jgi:hypothetical protein